jgi:hypothetical protein
VQCLIGVASLEMVDDHPGNLVEFDVNFLDTAEQLAVRESFRGSRVQPCAQNTFRVIGYGHLQDLFGVDALNSSLQAGKPRLVGCDRGVDVKFQHCSLRSRC